MATTEGESKEPPKRREVLYEELGVTYDKVIPHRIHPFDVALLVAWACVLVWLPSVWLQLGAVLVLLLQAMRLLKRSG